MVQYSFAGVPAAVPAGRVILMVPLNDSAQLTLNSSEKNDCDGLKIVADPSYK